MSFGKYPNTGSSGAATWGMITGTLSSQADLQSALNAKAALSGATFTGPVNAPSFGNSGAQVNFSSNSISMPLYFAESGSIALGSSVATVGIQNTFFGASAGNSPTLAGSANSGFGYNALPSLVGGHDNLAMGTSSGLSLTDGNFNSLIGTQAGNLLDTGSGNFLSGYQCGAALTGQSFNVMLGYQAGVGSHGSASVIIGQQAGGVAPSNSVHVGFQAGHTATSGGVLIGYQAGQDDHTVDYKNQFVGHNSGSNDFITGTQNTGTGALTLFNLNSGSHNNASGTSALQNNTSGSNNTANGYNAGLAIVAGNQNTLLGSGADASGDLTNSMALGAGAIAPASNTVMIGNTSVTKVLTSGALGVGNTAAATTPGSVVRKMEIFDASGSSLGFIAIYSSIT